MSLDIIEIMIDKIRQKLSELSQPCPERDRTFVLKYLGTDKEYLNIAAPARDKILKEVINETSDLQPKNIIGILDDLFGSGIYDYINFAGKFLSKNKRIRNYISFDQLENWITQTKGWAECDSVCQSMFCGAEVLDRWTKWEKAIKKFASSSNIQIRRASLVLQIRPAREITDPKFRQLAFETINKLTREKDILITKAISWLLRDLSCQDKMEVKKYLKKNRSILPSIAYRETIKKIETGKK